jgi:hypothetical protein
MKILDKAKPHTEDTKGLILAAVIYTTAQMSRLPWQRELLLVGYNLLYSARTDRGLACTGLYMLNIWQVNP